MELNDHNKNTDPDVIAQRNLTEQQLKASKNADERDKQREIRLDDIEAERARQFGITQARLDNQDKESARRFDAQEKRIFNESKERRLDRQLDKQMNAENNAMKMQLEYSRLAQADRYKAQDRKDKAIMMLVHGLGNLGTLFTV